MTLEEQIKTNYKSKNGVYYLTEPDNNFEDIYIKVRKKEGRIYSDDDLSTLPDINSKHRYYKEWMIRKKSLQMLSKYLNSKPKDKTLLEPGCGNGWLSNKLAGLGFSEVIGLDVNITELEQAARVFSGKDNLIFVYGDIFSLPLSGGDRRTYGASEGGLDFIILSSVIAYFKDLNALINSLLNKLNANGEIHIIDSPFYKDTSAARERSIKYYTELGLPEMAELYYQYSLDDLKGYNHSILYDPDTLVNKIKRKLNASLPPFYRVKITK